MIGFALRPVGPVLARALTALPVLLLLAACGGGGGGPPPGPGSVVYAGNTNPAVVTATNASALTANVVGSNDTATTILGLSTESSSATQNSGGGLALLGRNLNRGLRDTVLRVNAAQRVAAAAQVDQTEPCDGGMGSVRTSGTLSDVNFTGTLAVSFNSCLIGGLTLSGQATLRVDEFSFAFPQGIPADSTLGFSVLTIRGPGVSVDAGGSLRLQLNFSGTNTETTTANLVSRNNNTGAMSKTENLVSVSVYDNIFTPSSFTETIAGRLFHSAHGYVDITTVAPLVFGTLNQFFPDSGQLLLTGEGNRSIRVTALSATLARLALDLDGDSVVDNTATLKWSDLSGPIGADLADSDDDGMHNSWEAANGLNPLDPADGALDTDGDGARSLFEYLAGADPNDVNSVPPYPGQVVYLFANSDLLFDSVTQKIYAAVRGNPGAIIPINPTTGKMGSAIPVGIDPVKLARSDDGQFLYVGLDGENAVHRIDLATQLVNLTFSLGVGSFGPHFVEDMEVLPGSPQSLAVARKKKGFHPMHEGVAIFDDGVQRLAATPGHIGSNVIEFSASAGTLYGYSTESVPSGFFRMTVDALGVSVLDVTQNLINDLGNIEFDGGFIYSTGGSVIDPQTLTAVGSFSGLPGIPFTVSVRPDSSVGRVFFLIQTALDRIGHTATISAFNLNTRQLIDSVNIPGVMGDPGNLIRWGAKGLAFRTSDGQIFLIESSKLVP